MTQINLFRALETRQMPAFKGAVDRLLQTNPTFQQRRMKGRLPRGDARRGLGGRFSHRGGRGL